MAKSNKGKKERREESESRRIAQAGRSRESATVATLSGQIPRDVGTPGNTTQTLEQFVNTSDGPLSRAITDFDTRLVGYSPQGEFRVNTGNVQSAARLFVITTQDTQYSRDYLIELGQERARENGVNVNRTEAARLVNEDYAVQAEAILTTTRIGKVKLTEAQRRRLEAAREGRYLDMVYTTRSSERGSLANAVSRQRRTVSRDAGSIAARRERRREFLDNLGRLSA